LSAALAADGQTSPRTPDAPSMAPAPAGKPVPVARASRSPISATPGREPDGDEGAVGLAEASPASATNEEALPSNTNPDDTNVWPDENAEAAFIAEARGRGESPVATPPSAEEEDERSAKTLPPLSELVERIPAETRELMDELFRAKFVAVRKVKKSALKADS
jgi:hypothetical protein